MGLKKWVKFPKVINMAKMRATENLNTDPGSIFLEYAWSDNHFAISLQQIQFLMKNCILDPCQILKKWFLKFVKDQQCSFSSNTDVFWRDIAKWLKLQAYSRKMLPGSVYKFSVALIFVVFMTVSGSPKNIALRFKKKSRSRF